MHGGRVHRQNRGRSRRGQGQRCISDVIMLSIMALQWLKCAAKYWELDRILNNSNISKQSLSINIPHTVMCKFALLKWICGINKKRSLLHFSTVTVIQTVAIVYIR